MTTSIDEQLSFYLQDAHAIELQALEQIKRAPKLAGDPALADIFERHIAETEEQKRRADDRLEALPDRRRVVAVPHARRDDVGADPAARRVVEGVRELRAGLGRTGAFDVVLGPRMRIKDTSPQTAERFLKALDELKTAGVTWASVNIAHPSRAAYLERVRGFGEEVVPHAG